MISSAGVTEVWGDYSIASRQCNRTVEGGDLAGTGKRQSTMEHLEHCNCDQCLLVQMMADDCTVRQCGWKSWYLRDAPTLHVFIEQQCRALGFHDHSEDILQDCFLIGFRNVANHKYT